MPDVLKEPQEAGTEAGEIWLEGGEGQVSLTQSSSGHPVSHVLIKTGATPQHPHVPGLLCPPGVPQFTQVTSYECPHSRLCTRSRHL